MGKYIVTGGAGFIGSHITERLLAEGHEVLVVDNLSTGKLSHLPDNKALTFLNVDIGDWTSLSKNFAYFKGARGVFHLAACARIQPSIYNPMLTHDTNVTGTFNILEMMRMCDIKNIVYSASSSYYGKNAKIPSSEIDPADCQTPYSVSKYMGELYCETWSKLHGVSAARLRYFNVYGPRSPLEGQYAPVIGLFFRQAFEGKEITVVGTGEQRRDFTYIEDVVNANVLAMTNLECREEGKNFLFNIGTGRNYSIRQLANMVFNACAQYGVNPPIRNVPERIGEAQNSLANNQLAKSVIGWEPKHRLEDTVHTLAEYYANLYNVKKL